MPLEPGLRAKLDRVKVEIKKFDFVKDVAFGISSEGYNYLPVIKIGEEDKAVLIPEEIEGIRIYIRFERDD